MRLKSVKLRLSRGKLIIPKESFGRMPGSHRHGRPSTPISVAEWIFNNKHLLTIVCDGTKLSLQAKLSFCVYK